MLMLDELAGSVLFTLNVLAQFTKLAVKAYILGHKCEEGWVALAYTL